jgi:predicted ATPase
MMQRDIHWFGVGKSTVLSVLAILAKMLAHLNDVIQIIMVQDQSLRADLHVVRAPVCCPNWMVRAVQYYWFCDAY